MLHDGLIRHTVMLVFGRRGASRDTHYQTTFAQRSLEDRKVGWGVCENVKSELQNTFANISKQGQRVGRIGRLVQGPRGRSRQSRSALRVTAH